MKVKAQQRRMTTRLMGMKRKNLNPPKNKFSERESGSLCGREKTSADILMRKKPPWQMLFCHGYFVFGAGMLPVILCKVFIPVAFCR